MSTKHEIEAWRDKLSAMTADEIADLCREEEIKALPGVPTSCAIAQLITKKTGVEVWVGGEVSAVISENAKAVLFFTKWKGNGPLEFITKFDNGEYPNITLESCLLLSTRNSS